MHALIYTQTQRYNDLTLHPYKVHITAHGQIRVQGCWSRISSPASGAITVLAVISDRRLLRGGGAWPGRIFTNRPGHIMRWAMTFQQILCPLNYRYWSRIDLERRSPSVAATSGHRLRRWPGVAAMQGRRLVGLWTGWLPQKSPRSQSSAACPPHLLYCIQKIRDLFPINLHRLRLSRIYININADYYIIRMI